MAFRIANIAAVGGLCRRRVHRWLTHPRYQADTVTAAQGLVRSPSFRGESLDLATRVTGRHGRTGRILSLCGWLSPIGPDPNCSSRPVASSFLPWLASGQSATLKRDSAANRQGRSRPITRIPRGIASRIRRGSTIGTRAPATFLRCAFGFASIRPDRPARFAWSLHRPSHDPLAAKSTLRPSRRPKDFYHLRDARPVK
jgi:hypothetical protein